MIIREVAMKRRELDLEKRKMIDVEEIHYETNDFTREISDEI